MPIVFVVGQDWLLRAAVRAELRERGIEALGMETMDDAAKAIAGGRMPAAVVLEASAAGSNSAAVAELARRVPLIVVASRTESVEIPAAAAVLYRPARVGDIVARVLEILRGMPA